MSVVPPRAITTSLNLAVSLFQEPTPKVLIISHERSGTHFMMNSLALNFGFESNPWINLDHELGINFFAPEGLRDFLSALSKRPIRNLFKSHHTIEFFEPILSSIAEDYRIIYMVRDPFSTLASYHSFLQRLTWNEGPQDISLNDFVMSSPSGAMTRYQWHHSPSLAHRWANHVTGWIEAIRRLPHHFAIAIDFDCLNLDFDNTMSVLERFLGKPRRLPSVKPDRFENVIMPDTQKTVYINPRERYSVEAEQWIDSVYQPVLESVRKYSLSHPWLSDLACAKQGVAS